MNGDPDAGANGAESLPELPSACRDGDPDTDQPDVESAVQPDLIRQPSDAAHIPLNESPKRYRDIDQLERTPSRGLRGEVREER